MSFPKYPSYADSGVEWMGEVPAHWKTMPIRFAARLESGHTPSRSRPDWWENCTVPWFSLADVWQIRQGAKVVYETVEMVSELGLANSSARRLPKGTVMLSRTASVGFSAIMGTEMATTQDFANWVCGDKVLPQFLLYVFRSMSMEFRRLMMGSTHNTIYMPDIQALRFALPPIADQHAIVAFLDRETAKIDALVEEQKRLIELLQEKRQAVISQAVTNGLDLSVPMKNSGVKWLGEVPAHWQTSRLANLFSDTDERGNDELPVLTVSIHSGVSDDELDEADMDRKVTRSDDKTKYKRVQPGDLVYNMMRAWQGGFGSVAVNGMVSPAYVVARPRTPFPTAFIESVLRTPNAIEEMRGRSRGVTDFRLRLYWDEFKEIVVPLPPKDEVDEILGHLERLSSHSARTIEAAEECIAILNERRSALISAAVTGKIDVRGLAPQPEGAAA